MLTCKDCGKAATNRGMVTVCIDEHGMQDEAPCPNAIHDSAAEGKPDAGEKCPYCHKPWYAPAVLQKVAGVDERCDHRCHNGKHGGTGKTRGSGSCSESTADPESTRTFAGSNPAASPSDRELAEGIAKEYDWKVIDSLAGTFFDDSCGKPILVSISTLTAALLRTERARLLLEQQLAEANERADLMRMEASKESKARLEAEEKIKRQEEILEDAGGRMINYLSRIRTLESSQRSYAADVLEEMDAKAAWCRNIIDFRQTVLRPKIAELRDSNG